MGTKHYKDRRRQMISYGAGATVIPDPESRVVLAKSFARPYAGAPVFLRTLPSGEYDSVVYERTGDNNLKRVDEQSTRINTRDIADRVRGLEAGQVLVIVSRRVELPPRKPSRKDRRYSE